MCDLTNPHSETDNMDAWQAAGEAGEADEVVYEGDDLELQEREQEVIYWLDLEESRDP
jgi:hypothetical protein